MITVRIGGLGQEAYRILPLGTAFPKHLKRPWSSELTKTGLSHGGGTRRSVSNLLRIVLMAL